MRGQWGRLARLAARDAAALALVAALWAVLLGSAPEGRAAYVALSVLCAVAVTGLGYLAHEWGHLLGAIAAGAAFELPERAFESPFLFRFDRDRSSRPQFFAMALGGFAASIATVVAFLLLLPEGRLATWLALALLALGVAATLVIEVPEFWRVWRGAPLPDGAAFVSDRNRR
jgi:hypothetical protein